MHASREEYQAFHRRRYAVLRELLERCATPKAGRCLDVGGGGDISGAAALLRERFSKQMHAVDRESDVADGLEHGVATLACDFDREPLPYPDRHFDTVLFASVVEHLYNPRHVVDEIARVLEPGGLLLVEAPNAVALGRRLDALAGRNPFAVFNRYNAMDGKAPLINCAVFYTPEEVEELLGARFTVVERRFAMHAPPLPRWKAAMREAAFRLNPRLGDCFFLAARRRDD